MTLKEAIAALKAELPDDHEFSVEFSYDRYCDGREDCRWAFFHGGYGDLHDTDLARLVARALAEWTNAPADRATIDAASAALGEVSNERPLATRGGAE